MQQCILLSVQILDCVEHPCGDYAGPCSNSEIKNRETFVQQFSFCRYIIMLPPLLNSTFECFRSKCMVHNVSRLEHCYGTHIINISRLSLTHWYQTHQSQATNCCHTCGNLASSPGSLLPPEVNWAKVGGSLGSEIT